MSKKRRIPQRKCVSCEEMKSKNDLTRVIKSPEGQIMIDSTGKQNGRGAYMCNSISCFEKAKDNRCLERSLRSQIPENVYEELAKELKEIGM